MTELKDFSRHELQDIYERASKLSMSIPSSCWIRAYENLASAVDHLDAMIARSQEQACQEMNKK